MYRFVFFFLHRTTIKNTQKTLSIAQWRYQDDKYSMSHGTRVKAHQSEQQHSNNYGRRRSNRGRMEF